MGDSEENIHVDIRADRVKQTLKRTVHLRDKYEIPKTADILVHF